MANAHRRRNCIQNISINGKRLDKEAEIKEGLVDAFQNLLSDPGGWHPTLTGISFNEIGNEEVAKLEEAFTKEEVWKAISCLNRDKAPGLDDFPLGFRSFSWDFVKDEVPSFFKEFHE